MRAGPRKKIHPAIIFLSRAPNQAGNVLDFRQHFLHFPHGVIIVQSFVPVDRLGSSGLPEKDRRHGIGNALHSFGQLERTAGDAGKIVADAQRRSATASE